MIDVILKRFEAPDEIRVLTKGKFEIVRLGGMTIGRATYEPGWKWSEHVGPTVGATRCTVEHVGWYFPGRQPQRLMGGCLSFGRANYSTFPQLRMIAG
jgi:hypothetical protein